MLNTNKTDSMISLNQSHNKLRIISETKYQNEKKMFLSGI